MKHCFLLLVISLTCSLCFAQPHFVDSLHHRLINSREDTSRVQLLVELGNYYGFNRFDSAIYYGQKAIDLSTRLNYLYGNYLGLKCFFFAYNTQGNYPKALEVTLQSLKIAEKIKEEKPVAFASATYCQGVLNRQMNNLSTALEQFHKAIEFFRQSNVPFAEAFPAYSQLGLLYQKLQRFDSALWYAQRGYDLSLQPNTWTRFICLSSTVLGYVHTSMRNYDTAKKYLLIGASESKKVNNVFFLAWNYNVLANLFMQTNNPDSCIYYARISLPLWRAHNFGEFAVNASALLAQVYEAKNQPDSTIKYMRLMMAAKDSVFNQSKVKEFQKFVFDEEKRKEDIQKEQEKYKDKIKMYVLLGTMIVLLFVAAILWRNNRQKQRAKAKIEKAYTELKITQNQLIQSEKMASLGELTAGIAHEIQNPLNFVNNFSEVNKELAEELKSELAVGNLQLATEIINDMKDNSEKINHHGKRADAIVKGMLQHSRTSTGQKEPTDINALCDEYLRLSYQGLRARDMNFNAAIQTDFDNSIGKINIVPQDIGRVLLNLYNNAFYAVREKAASEELRDPGAGAYVPTVSVSTKKAGNKVLISVADNGNGIPQNIIDKIFQPFFTTKPTGQGTGLGLSLAYDIVKAHGGEIKVETKENEGSVFVIELS